MQTAAFEKSMLTAAQSPADASNPLHEKKVGPIIFTILKIYSKYNAEFKSVC